MRKLAKTLCFIYAIFFAVNIHASAISTEKNYLFAAQKNKIIAFADELAAKYKFDRKYLIALFKSVKIRIAVIKNIEHPFESMPWYLYKKNFLTESKINNGVAFYQKYYAPLKRAEKIYGVPASIIVAIIGIESDYGKEQGKYEVLEALSNLAFMYKPREKFFQSELKEFLLLCREKKIDPKSVYGSYAGAIGQAQFMPSSFRMYAVKFGDDHKSIDLSANTYDVIGSIANYFNKNGWEKDGLIAKYAILEKAKEKSLPPIKYKPEYHLQELMKNGLVPKNFKKENLPCMYMQLENALHKLEYWIGFKNFYVITRYNTSTLYAMTAFRLSEEINKLASIKKPLV